MKQAHHRILPALSAAILLAGLALSPAARASAIKQDMHAMKHDYQTALASATMPAFIQSMQAFQNDVRLASQLNYGADPATYRQGMQELQVKLQIVNDRIRANDLPGAKNALGQIDALRHHYHNQLN